MSIENLSKVNNLKAGRMVLIGGGGHCKSVLDATLRMQVFGEIVIVDPEMSAGTIISGCKVAGDDSLLPALYADGFTHAVVSVGSIRETLLRHRLVDKAKGIGFAFTTIIDPSAVVARSASIGEGVFIGKNAVVNTDAVIGDHTIINTGAIIEHDCRIGAFSHIAVGAVVCGGAEIGEDAFIGANATVVQGIKIGAGTTAGAGAVVTQDIPGHCLAVGVPAKVVKEFGNS
ncbi:MAG: NeuD/PglB/VioB family sugar acetyltransferase [Lachnospiraceae bacterium]|nr:NeuD/PglB/VioB family sugar acetyltransferase [Lachnospiraceae bacterium]